MKKSAVIFFILLYCSCQRYAIRYATNSDIVQKEPDEKISKGLCKNPENYIPDESLIEATPVRYLRVNFHIMQRSDGGGTFNVEQGIEYCHELIDDCNRRWADNAQMNLPEGNNTPVLPTQIRLELVRDARGNEAIYFHRDDSLCYFIRNAKSGPYALNDKGIFNKYSTGTDSIINIFLLEHFPDSLASPTYGTQSNGISYGNNIKIAGSYYNKYTNFPRGDGTYFNKGADQYGKLINHEIGHSLGLFHTWNWDDSCGDTPKNNGCWSQTENPPCNVTISNNLMDYNWSQQAVTPCQLGRMHYNLSFNEQRNWCVPYWCDYHPSMRVVIGRGDSVVWLGAKDLWGDIEIKEHATLVVRCVVSLPATAKIIIKPDAKLIINGGTITNRCGDLWDGIEIWSDKKTNEQGHVILINKGKMEEMKNYITLNAVE